MVLSRTISTHTHITARPVPDRVGQALLLQPHDTVWKALQTHHRRFDDGVEKQGMQEGERQQQVHTAPRLKLTSRGIARSPNAMVALIGSTFAGTACVILAVAMLLGTL